MPVKTQARKLANGFTDKGDGAFLTPEFRAAFVNIFEPSKLDGKYNCVMIFDPDTDFSVLEEAIEEVVQNKWGAKKPKVLDLPILDGDDQGREETKGKFYINGKCGKFRPGLVDANGAEIIQAEEFYAGCFAHAVVTLYAWEYQRTKAGVSVNIRNIQKLRDGEPLVSRVSAEDDFGSVKSENDL